MAPKFSFIQGYFRSVQLFRWSILLVEVYERIENPPQEEKLVAWGVMPLCVTSNDVSLRTLNNGMLSIAICQ